MAKNFKAQAPNALIDPPARYIAPVAEPRGTQEVVDPIPAASDKVAPDLTSRYDVSTTIDVSASPDETARITARVSPSMKAKLDAWCFFFRRTQREGLEEALGLLFDGVGEAKMRDAVQSHLDELMRKQSRRRSAGENL